MAVKIDILETLSKQYIDKKYTYKDLTLDIAKADLYEPGYKTPVPGSDIKASFDENAIANSLINLFNTLPGQRFLFPDYGLNVNQYLFLPITRSIGQAIGEQMLNTINTYEPRVSVENINVTADPDNNRYLITISILIPSLNKVTIFNSELNTESRSFAMLTKN
jgi:phage baseplate assembly protein W